MKSVSENIYVLHTILEGDELKVMENIDNIYYQEDSNVLVIGDVALKKVKEILEPLSDGEYPIYFLYEDGIEGYVNTQYDCCEYNIFGSSGSYKEFAEFTKEEFEYSVLNNNFNFSEWENYVEKIIKECIIGHVNDDIRNQIEALKNDGFNIHILEF